MSLWFCPNCGTLTGPMHGPCSKCGTPTQYAVFWDRQPISSTEWSTTIKAVHVRGIPVTLTAHAEVETTEGNWGLINYVPSNQQPSCQAPGVSAESHQAAMRSALEFIAAQENLMFAECSLAEEIIGRAKTALGGREADARYEADGLLASAKERQDKLEAAEAKLVQAEQEKAEAKMQAEGAGICAQRWLMEAAERVKVAEARLASQEALTEDVSRVAEMEKRIRYKYQAKCESQEATIRQVAQEMRYLEEFQLNIAAPQQLRRWADTLRDLTEETPEPKG